MRDGENGYLFDDVEGCAAAMERAFDAPAEVREASYRTALENSRERSAELYVEAYELAKRTRAERTGHGTE